MKTTSKAIIFGIATEAVPLSFVVIDHCIGVEAVCRATHDQASFYSAMRAAPKVFYYLGQSTHEPAVCLLGYLDLLVEAALGVAGGKPLFFLGFGTPSPAWTLICTTQAMMFVCFWAAVFAIIQYRSRAA
jgi:hypothetical protein